MRTSARWTLSATLALLIASLLLTPAHSQPRTASYSAPAGRSPQPGEVDAQASRVYLHFARAGLAREHVAVGQLHSGQIRLGAKKNAGNLVIEVATLECDTPAARQYFGLKGTASPAQSERLTHALLDSNGLHLRKHPSATLILRSAIVHQEQTVPDKTRFYLSGDLTLRGVTHPVELDALASPTDDSIRLVAEMPLSQKQFKLHPWKSLAGLVNTADELRVIFDLELAQGSWDQE